MKFNSETVEFRGETFEIRELSVGDLMPVIKVMDEDPVKGQQQLMAKAIYKDGVAIGDDYLNYPGAMMIALADAVMCVNSLGADEVEKKS